MCVKFAMHALISLFSLTEEDVKQDSLLSLNYVKFQNVQNLTVSQLAISIFLYKYRLTAGGSYIPATTQGIVINQTS